MQHFIFHLAPNGIAGVVLAKGALTSKSSGEGDIRKSMIADGNLKYMRQWYQFWSENALFVQQLVTQIPWWHNVIIISKIKEQDDALFYV